MAESNIRGNDVQQPAGDTRTMFNQADAKTVGDVNSTVQALKGAAPEQVSQILRDQIQQEMRDHYLSPGQLRCYTQALTEEATKQGLLNNITLTYESGHVIIDDRNVNAQTKVSTPNDYAPGSASNATDTKANANASTDASSERHEGRHRRDRKDAGKQAAEANTSANPANTTGDNVQLPPAGPTRDAVTVNPAQAPVENSVTNVPPTDVTRSTVMVNPNQVGSDARTGISPPSGSPRVESTQAPADPSRSTIVQQAGEQNLPPVSTSVNRPLTTVRPHMDSPEEQAKKRFEFDRNHYSQDANAGANGQILQQDMEQLTSDERAYYSKLRTNPRNQDAMHQAEINKQEQQWVKWEGDQEKSVIMPRTERPEDQNNQRRLDGDWQHYQADAKNHAPAQVLENDMQQVVRDSKAFHDQWRSRPENQDAGTQAYINVDEQQWISAINQQENQVIKPSFQLQQQQARQYNPGPYNGYTGPYLPQPGVGVPPWVGPGGTSPFYPQMVPPVMAPPVISGPGFNVYLPQVLRIGGRHY